MVPLPQVGFLWVRSRQSGGLSWGYVGPVIAARFQLALWRTMPQSFVAHSRLTGGICTMFASIRAALTFWYCVFL